MDAFLYPFQMSKLGKSLVPKTAHFGPSMGKIKLKLTFWCNSLRRSVPASPKSQFLFCCIIRIAFPTHKCQDLTQVPPSAKFKHFSGPQALFSTLIDWESSWSSFAAKMKTKGNFLNQSKLLRTSAISPIWFFPDLGGLWLSWLLWQWWDDYYDFMTMMRKALYQPEPEPEIQKWYQSGID